MNQQFYLCTLLSLFLVIPTGSTAAEASANAWMKTPTPELSPDNVSASIRHARDNFFDMGIGASAPLTPDSASAFHLAEGSHFHRGTEQSGEASEIPFVSDRAVVIGTFTGHRSILTSSKRYIYTEIDVLVSHVFEADGSVAEGSTITIEVPGGSVSISDGKTLSYLTDPKEYFIEPPKKYLFVLSYNETGAFYTIAKTWDLSSGVVKPNSRADQVSAQRGQSSIIGLSENRLIPVLQGLLSSERK